MHASTLILQLIDFLEDHVRDKSSMIEIKDCLEDREFGTERSRNIFDTVRAKTLKAEKLGQDDVIIQRAFEEACAKALFNFGRPSAAYDPDAQFWIVPYAFRLAQRKGLSESEIIDLVTRG